MKTLNQLKLLFPVIFLAMICFCSFAQKQMPVQKMSDIEKLIELNPAKKMESIALTNDSKMLIAKKHRPYKFELKNKRAKIAEKELNTVNASFEFEVVKEEEIEIEEWMLKPFEKESSGETEAFDVEDEIELETWMTDLNLWE